MLPADLLKRIDALIEPLPPKLRRSEAIQRKRDELIQGITFYAEAEAMKVVDDYESRK